MRVKLFTSVMVTAVALAASALSGTANAFSWMDGDLSVRNYVQFKSTELWSGYNGYFQCPQGTGMLRMSSTSYLDVWPAPGYSPNQTIVVVPIYNWWNGTSYQYWNTGDPISRATTGQDVVFGSSIYFLPRGFAWRIEYVVSWNVRTQQGTMMQVARARYSTFDSLYMYDLQHGGYGGCYT